MTFKAPFDFQAKPGTILLVAPVLLTTFRYYGSVDFFNTHFAGGSPPAAASYLFFSSFFLLGIIPLLIISWAFQESPRDYGVAGGDWRFGIRALVVMAPLLVFASWLSSRNPQFAAEYPINKAAGKSGNQFLLHALLYFAYYCGWEFFFRGFMLFGLRASLGAFNAILVQTLASCLIHIGKPDNEIFASIPAGIIWGMMALRTGSFWPVLAAHWILGVSLDYFLCFR